MKNKTKQKICFILSAYLLLSGFAINEGNKKPSVTYCEEYNESKRTPFACIGDDSYVYIGSTSEIESIRDDSSKDIYVEDRRSKEDPDMRICNSYEIIKPGEMEAILDVLQEYERKYPTLWERTTKNMKKEWIAHNICYYLHYETKRTDEVDLNNDDEDDYENNRFIRLLNK